MWDMAQSTCLIKLYQITMRKNFDFLFLTTLILWNLLPLVDVQNTNVLLHMACKTLKHNQRVYQDFYMPYFSSYIV